MDVLAAAIPLILKALWLSSRWAGILRVHALKRVARDNDPESEIVFLRDRVAQLEVELELARGQRRKRGSKPRYTVRERCSRPDDIFAGKKPVNLPRDAKRIPPKIERHVFPETRTTAYRLKKAA